MTRDEIMQLKGRELDALVATEIFDLIVNTDLWLTFETVDSDFEGLKAYSSDISAAWEVVEKLQPTLWVRMNSMLGDHYCGVGRPDLQWEHRSKSMPEAICKASLLAVMEVDNDPSL